MEEKDCKISKECGGCHIQNAGYQKQLKDKTNEIKKTVKEKLSKDIQVNDIIGMENPYYYRNKAKFVFGRNQKEEPVMGFFKEGTHRIVECHDCKIQDKTSNQIAIFLFELFKKYHIKVYNEDNQKGFLRHLIIRNAIHTNEYMVIIVTTDNKINKREAIIKELLQKFPNIKTVVQNINDKQTNAILGDRNINLYGKGFIVDYIKEYKFKISPLSFYQVNPIQTEKLYQKAVELAQITKNDIVCDLYSGIGTISIFTAQHAKKVYGIEIVKEAVKDAIENARFNKIENIKFLEGKVEVLLPKLCSKLKHIDVIFVDPPRSGLDRKTIQTLLDIKAKKIIYISCNLETLVDNLIELKKLYQIELIQPVDMFPFTSHVECVAVLQLKN